MKLPERKVNHLFMLWHCAHRPVLLPLDNNINAKFMHLTCSAFVAPSLWLILAATLPPLPDVATTKPHTRISWERLKPPINTSLQRNPLVRAGWVTVNSCVGARDSQSYSDDATHWHVPVLNTERATLHKFKHFVVLCTVYMRCYFRECVNKSSSITLIVNCMLLAFVVSSTGGYVELFEELIEFVNPII